MELPIPELSLQYQKGSRSAPSFELTKFPRVWQRTPSTSTLLWMTWSVAQNTANIFGHIPKVTAPEPQSKQGWEHIDNYLSSYKDIYIYIVVSNHVTSWSRIPVWLTRDHLLAAEQRHWSARGFPQGIGPSATKAWIPERDGVANSGQGSPPIRPSNVARPGVECVHGH